MLNPFLLYFTNQCSLLNLQELQESIENTRTKIAELIDEKNKLVHHINEYKTELVNAKNEALLYLNSKLKLRKISKLVEGLLHYRVQLFREVI